MRFRNRHPESGAALVTALILLTVILLMGVTAMRSTTLELRMAKNEESRVNALEQSQALTEKIADDPDNSPILYGTDYSACFIATGLTPPAPFTCGTPDADFEARVTDSGTNTLFTQYVYASVARQEPENVPIPRNIGVSGDKFTGALFAVTGGFNRSDAGLGAAESEQGILRLKPRFQGINN